MMNQSYEEISTTGNGEATDESAWRTWTLTPGRKVPRAPLVRSATAAAVVTLPALYFYLEVQGGGELKRMLATRG